MVSSTSPLSSAFSQASTSQDPPPQTPARSRFQTMSVEEAIRANEEISKQGIDQLDEEDLKELCEDIQSALAEPPSDVPVNSGAEEEIAEDSSFHLSLKPFKRRIEEIVPISPLILEPSNGAEKLVNSEHKS